MLTLFEKVLFIAAVCASIYFGYVGFRKVYEVVMRGPGEKPTFRQMMGKLWHAAVTWLTTKPIWKTRPFSSTFHIMISAGFVFYFLVNFGDVLEGLFPITFLGNNLLGDFYRFLADLATMSVLIGIIYFIFRRFVFRDKALTYRENIKLLDRVKNGGIRRDSLIVALFILFHVGFRWLGNSFKVSLEGFDPWQPFSSALGSLWASWPETAKVVGEHLGFWIAIGLILAFIPYFPYTKHFHLIMSGINFLTKPKRTSLGTLEPINFEDESIQEFGVDKIEKLPWTHLVDAYACIMCNRCQDACPAYVTGKELSPSALEVNKRYYPQRAPVGAGGRRRIRVLADRLCHQRVGRVGLHGLRRLRQHLPGRATSRCSTSCTSAATDADGKRVPQRTQAGLSRHGAQRQPVEPEPA